MLRVCALSLQKKGIRHAHGPTAPLPAMASWRPAATRRLPGIAMTKRILALLLLLLPAVASNLAGADGFLVVVNAANPVTSLAAGEISRMFLHKTMRWPGGGRVVPIDLPEGSPVRDAFSRAIHGRRTSAIQAY